MPRQIRRPAAWPGMSDETDAAIKPKIYLKIEKKVSHAGNAAKVHVAVMRFVVYRQPDARSVWSAMALLHPLD